MQGFWQEETVPGSPDSNMAADLTLLEAVRDGAIFLPVVRVYTWDRPAVSYGRLQSEQTVREAFPGLPLVRRPTGGRAVRHGDDLTLTVATRQDWLPQTEGRGVLSSYRQIVRGLVRALQAVGIDAALGTERTPRPDSVDCFASVAACDVADAQTGVKLIGCAQRRDGGAILQQMSLPLNGMLRQAEAAFRAQVKTELGCALGVTEWQLVDTRPPV